ncbi:hypothetical protein TNCV_3105861 [Trichonephila clavipes]|nr:hypothetical protein TNCV_3105861 [Trichonephila clavipes]
MVIVKDGRPGSCPPPQFVQGPAQYCRYDENCPAKGDTQGREDDNRKTGKRNVGSFFFFGGEAKTTVTINPENIRYVIYCVQFLRYSVQEDTDDLSIQEGHGHELVVGMTMFKSWIPVLVPLKTLYKEDQGSKSSCWGSGSLKTKMPV